MDSKKITAIMRVFERLPQHRLIIGWDAESSPISTAVPANVLVLPHIASQNAILAHRNTRLFISSCDRQSLGEARFHGVPVLGLPLQHEQHLLLRPAMDEDWARPMSFHYLDERSLHFGLDQMLNATAGRYERRPRVAQLFRDRQRPAMETAVWWVEYVVRHGGAEHLRSEARRLNWAQRNGLDVVALWLWVAWLWWRMSKIVWRWSRLVIGWIVERLRNRNAKCQTVKAKKE